MWNCVAIHAYGKATVFEDANKQKAHLAVLTDRFESGYNLPWKINDAPQKFIDGMCLAIIRFEITIDQIGGKWKASQNKASQNKASDDRIGVVNGLRTQGDRAMADLVEAAHAESEG